MLKITKFLPDYTGQPIYEQKLYVTTIILSSYFINETNTFFIPFWKIFPIAQNYTFVYEIILQDKTMFLI